MPKIMMIAGYQISIWSNENGTFIVAHNKSRIDEKDLRKIIKRLNIVEEQVRVGWITYHGYEKYYR